MNPNLCEALTEYQTYREGLQDLSSRSCPYYNVLTRAIMCINQAVNASER
jgi:hypothetical protein